MTFLEALWTEASSARTPWLAGLLVATFFLGKAFHVRALRFRALAFFSAMHVVMLTIGAGMAAGGSGMADDFRVPAWVFGAVAFVGVGGTLVFDVLLPRVHLRVPRIVEDVLVGLFSVGTGVAVASRAGVNLSGLIATSAVFTAMLGFSLQDVIGNIAGGLALQVDNSIEVGDWVKVNDVVGKVVEIRWRHTSIETRNWETVLLPNSVLMKSQVMVLGRRHGQPKLWRRWVYFSVDWRHQPSDVIEAVQNAVRGAKINRVADDPPPNCVLMDMTDSYGKYAVRYWLTDLSADDPTDSDVRTRIFFALHRANMKPAVAAHTVFVHEEDQEAEQLKTEKQVTRRRKLLAGIELFSTLSDAEREEIAHLLKYAPFTGGEIVTRQGAEAHWLYLVEDGQAAVRVTDGEIEKEVAKLKGPAIFGEMSLLTGAPRSATVVAETDVECFRLDKVAVQRILERRPDLARDLAAMLSKRQTELMAVKDGLDAESARRHQAAAEKDLFNRIRHFFSLK